MSIAEIFYKQHYEEVISKALTEDEKQILAKKISELTLSEPIWLSKKDYAAKFPELKPFIHVKLTGLYLCGIIAGIVDELQKEETS